MALGLHLKGDARLLTALIDFLQSSPYFTGLGPSELDSIAKLILGKTVGKGEIISWEGDPGEAVYFVASGAVKYFKTSDEGKEQILRIVLTGDSFNDMVVFDSGPNPASAEAISSVVLYVITRSNIERIVQDHPRVVFNAARILAGRMRQLLELVEDLSFRHVISRVAKLLLSNAGDGAGGKTRLTQQEMAAATGTAREVVGRSLKALQEDGAIRMERNHIVIVDKQALREMAGSGA